MTTQPGRPSAEEMEQALCDLNSAIAEKRELEAIEAQVLAERRTRRTGWLTYRIRYWRALRMLRRLP